MKTRVGADDLRRTIANLKQSRRSTARSLHGWLDSLITDAESQLRRLTPAGDTAPPPVPTPPPSARPAPSAPPGMPNPRTTYPFDEHAPWQRAS